MLFAGCAGVATSADTQAIRGGSDDSGDPAVGALDLTGGHPYCTATLIAPHTVLTAGHCDLTDMLVDFGAAATAPDQAIAVVDAVQHPMYTAEGQPFDFALMKLASDPVGVAPVVVGGEPMSGSDVGAAIRHVGFGVTDDSTGSGEGTKRTVTYPITKVDSMFVFSGAPGEQTCDGDSGGPGFLGDTLVAVVSDGPNCNLDMDGYDDRTDVVADWIVDTTRAWDAAPTVTGRAASGGGCEVGAGATSPTGALALALAVLYSSRRRRNASHASARFHHGSSSQLAGTYVTLCARSASNSRASAAPTSTSSISTVSSRLLNRLWASRL